ncbi:MAG: tetratricopeptide repeat protein [Candidatus Krumholzibacteria bacterium]
MDLKRECIRMLVGLALVLLALNVQATTSPETDTLLRQAREAAEKDQHERAIDFYRRAIAQDPLLKGPLATEVAHQYTWAEVTPWAIAWYRVALREDPSDMEAKIGLARALSWEGLLDVSETYYREILPATGEHRNDVLIGLAKVLSWQGSHGEAEKIYRDVLERNPEHSEARLGLAEVANSSGRHREAEALYREALLHGPENTEARKGLAYAQHWSGRSDLALQTLRAGNADDDLQKAVRDIKTDRRLGGSNTFSFRDNSTDGDFYQLESSVRMAPMLRSEVTLTYATGRLKQSGSPDILRDQLSAVFQKNLSSVVAVSVGPGVQWNRFDTVTLPPNQVVNNGFNLLVWDVYATLRPDHRVRVDIGNSRQTLDIPQSIFREIRVTETNAGVDWRLQRRLITFWALKYGSYSDTNSRFALSQRAEWNPRLNRAGRWQNAFVLTEGVEYWDFEQALDNGYFNPLTYAHVFGGVGFAGDLSPRVHAEVSGRFGVEKESGQDWTNAGSFTAAIRVKATQRFFVGAGYNGSGSRLDSPDGFRSNGFFVSVEYPLGH